MMNELTIEDIKLLDQRVNEQLGRLQLTNQIWVSPDLYGFTTLSERKFPNKR